MCHNHPCHPGSIPADLLVNYSAPVLLSRSSSVTSPSTTVIVRILLVMTMLDVATVFAYHWGSVIRPPPWPHFFKSRNSDHGCGLFANTSSNTYFSSDTHLNVCFPSIPRSLSPSPFLSLSLFLFFTFLAKELLRDRKQKKRDRNCHSTEVIAIRCDVLLGNAGLSLYPSPSFSSVFRKMCRNEGA